MEVDESRRYRQAIGPDDARRVGVDPPGFDDATATDGDVAEVRRQPTAVVNPSTLDEQIMSHTASSLLVKAYAELTDSRTQMSTEPFSGACRTPCDDRKMIGNRSKQAIRVEY
jgi:hypothetical protein